MEPFLGEIRLFPWSWLTEGWHLCDGTLLEIASYTALYSLLGVRYGGDGTSTFGLPDLRGRTLVGCGANNLGVTGGAENVTLSVLQLPMHRHMAVASQETGTAFTGLDGYPAEPGEYAGNPTIPIYATGGNVTPLMDDAVSSAGGGGAHSNVQPSLGLNYCIAMQGLYPTRT